MYALIIKILYRAGILIYLLGVKISSLWNPKAKAWIDGRKETFQVLSLNQQTAASRSRIWMHCASSGEYQQGRPLLQQLRSLDPDVYLYVSFFSPSGYKAWHSDVLIDTAFYLPIDTSSNAKKLIALIEPELVVFVKNEFWFDTIKALTSYKIPVVFTNINLSEGHHIFLPYFKNVMMKVDHFFVQDKESEKILTRNGFTCVTVTGDMRVDYVLGYQQDKGIPDLLLKLREKFKICIVYGSIWKEDMAILQDFISFNKNILHIIVPHEVDIKSITKIIKSQPHCLTLSSIQGQPNTNTIIVDQMGILKSLYSLADIAYIGGGFGKGIHNILEPSKYYIPIMFGPKYKKFKEAHQLITLGVAMPVKDAEQLERVYHNLMSDPIRTKEQLEMYFNMNKGATIKTVNKLKALGYV